VTKRSGVVGATALLLVLGFTVPAGAQQDQHEKPQQQDHPAPVDTQHHARAQKRVTPAEARKQQHARTQNPAHPTQPRGPQRQEEGRPTPQSQSPYTTDRQGHPQRSPSTRVSSRPQPVPQGEQRGVWQEHRAQNWRDQHHTWQERGGYHGYRIPEDRYRAALGRDHAFRIYRYPLTVVRGHPRFQYDGFWFSVVDPWPEYWSNDWYQTDDVYIDYSGDGYYLYDPRYPGDRIAISVSVY
jgi:hypothetical protein